MKIDKSKVKRILVIGLSNIGDAILTTPVIQVLRKDFPQVHLALLVGPRAFSVFKNDRRIDNKIIYDKAISWRNKLALVNRLRQDRYDLVVDLRQTAFSILLGTRYKTSVFANPPKSLVHMMDRHLWKLQFLGLDIGEVKSPSVEFNEDDQNYINRMLNKWQIKEGQIVIAASPGARNITKRWEKQGYIQLVKRLIEEYDAKIVIVGDKQDRTLAEEIITQIKPAPINICGRTTIGQLAFLLTKCRLLLSNDSAPMHLAWAMDTAVIAMFGPTSYKKYAPAGLNDVVIHKNLPCSPCEKSLCSKGTRDCMKLISVDEVFAACKKILDEKL